MKSYQLYYAQVLLVVGIILLSAQSVFAAEMIEVPLSESTDISAQMEEVQELLPVYRLYNPVNGEHLYTTDNHERMVLWTGHGWIYEGIGWYAEQGGAPVFRLYNPHLGNHLYTSDGHEVQVLTGSQGWQADNGGNPLFFSAGDIPIYRLYNRRQNGMHLISTDAHEYEVLPAYGWKQEGVKMYAAALGESIPTFTALNAKNHVTQDAKLGFDNWIVTSMDGKLSLISRKSGESIRTAVPSNWVDVLEEERIAVASASSMRTRIVRFNSAGAVMQTYDVFGEKDGFRIDPSILKHQGMYYLTSTKIDGEVNCKDPAQTNGHYTIELYKSKDLKNWEMVSTIVEADLNLEDPDLMVIDGKLSLIFEEETRDRSASSVRICVSEDGGLSFGEPLTLAGNGADNEPASFWENGTRYSLFYSSDARRPGESYQGASIYMNEYNSVYELLRSKLLPSNPQSGLLLYDVRAEGEGFLFLFSEDYLGRNQLRLQYLSRAEVLH